MKFVPVIAPGRTEMTCKQMTEHSSVPGCLRKVEEQDEGNQPMEKQDQ